MTVVVAALLPGCLGLGLVWAQDKKSVALHDITWVDQLKWATQVIVAPERLRDVAPVYVYPARVYEEIGGIAAIRDSKVRVGIARKLSETEWQALPLSSMYADDIDEMAEKEQIEDIDAVFDDNQKYIFFSKRLRDVPEYEMLWASWSSIRDFLPTTAAGVISRGR